MRNVPSIRAGNDMLTGRTLLVFSGVVLAFFVSDACDWDAVVWEEGPSSKSSSFRFEELRDTDMIRLKVSVLDMKRVISKGRDVWRSRDWRDQVWNKFDPFGINHFLFSRIFPVPFFFFINLDLVFSVEKSNPELPQCPFFWFDCSTGKLFYASRLIVVWTLHRVCYWFPLDMLTHRGFSAWVVSNGQVLPEYLVAVDEQSHRVSCWIPGAEGHVRSSLHPQVASSWILIQWSRHSMSIGKIMGETWTPVDSLCLMGSLYREGFSSDKESLHEGASEHPGRPSDHLCSRKHRTLVCPSTFLSV